MLYYFGGAAVPAEKLPLKNLFCMWGTFLIVIALSGGGQLLLPQDTLLDSVFNNLVYIMPSPADQRSINLIRPADNNNMWLFFDPTHHTNKFTHKLYVK